MYFMTGQTFCVLELKAGRLVLVLFSQIARGNAM